MATELNTAVTTPTGLLGHDGSGPGTVTPTRARTLLNVENGATADQTAQEIATAIDADATAESTLQAALVTTAAVTSAGALMDSEVTNLADVKAFDPADYATGAEGDLAASAVQPSSSDTLTNKTIDGDNNTISNLDLGNEVDWAAADDVTTRTAFASGDKILIFEAGVGMRKIDYDDLPGAGGGLSNVIEDTTPQLGGALDVNGNKIVSVTNGDIDIEPNGTGNVLLGNFEFDADQTVGAGQDNYVLTYDNSSGLISLEAAASGSGDPFTETTSTTESSPYTLSGITGNHVHTITALDTDLTINKPTGTFTSDVRQWVILDIVASAATRTLTLGTGITKAGGADLNLAIASGNRFILSLWTDDGGTTFYYDGDLDIASYPSGTIDPDNDKILWADANDSDKPKQSALPVASSTAKGIVELAIASEVDTGTDATRAVTPDALAGSTFGKRFVTVFLNGTTALTTSDEAVFVLPDEFAGYNLVGFEGQCGDGSSGASSSGDVTLVLTNMTSGQPVLATGSVIDAGDYVDGGTTATTIDTDEDDVTAGDIFKLTVSGAGTGVEHCRANMVWQLP